MGQYESGESSGFSKGLLIGIFTGGAIGAALALLFAPKSGRELRSELSEATNKYIDKAGDILNTANERSREIINEGRTRAESIVDDARSKASSLLSDAEKIVNEARAKVASTSAKIAGDMKGQAGKLADAARAGTEAFRDELRSTPPPSHS
ncbi:MAG: YtxH domain-containing protein [Bacteroidetes bacterium]|nr:YtxH domain-containing protein [Bacteroidota bacterium]